MKKLLIVCSSLMGFILVGNIAIAQYDHRTKDEGHEEHGMMEIPEGKPVPTVDLIVHEDAMKGWNLEMKVTNFTFAPERINQTSNLGEGHAHLYINGKKITRLYGNWYYLSTLEPGRNEIKVGLNANSHEQFMYRGQAVEDIAIVEVK